MLDNIQIARNIIKDNLFMVLATSSKNNEPWATPVFFAVDDQYNFFFISGKETRHALYINDNPLVSAVIFDSTATPETADGVYIEGKASEVSITRLPKVLNLVYRKRFPNPLELANHMHVIHDFLDGKPRRFYQITPYKMYKLDKNNTTEVDKRVELNLDQLRN
jgi:uncharacterized protein YhbP (UPF0306 family)